MRARSVHRPPKSTGLYSLPDANLLLEHALSTYFRHYKLYQVSSGGSSPCWTIVYALKSGRVSQYSFTVRNFLDLELAGRLYETAEPLRALGGAYTEDEWKTLQDEKRLEAEQRRLREEEEAAAAAEETRQQALLAEYEAVVPEDIARLINAAVEMRVAAVKSSLEGALAEKEGSWLKTLAAKGSKA